MSASRLLTMLLLLQNRGKLTTRELSHLLEISERTVHRDLEALSAAGIPVYAERGRSGGWKLTQGYRTRLTGMKPSELTALLLGADAALLADLGILDDYDAAARKLEAAARPATGEQADQQGDHIHIDGYSWDPSHESVPYLPLIRQAVQENRRIRMQYGRNGDVKERIIEPLGLVAKRGVWYAAASCEGDIRTYRISRMINAELTEEVFQRAADFDLEAYWEQSVRDFKAALPRYEAELQVRESALHGLRNERYVKVLNACPSVDPEWIAVAAEFQTLGSAIKIALSYGTDLIATAPSELARQIAATARSIAALYSEDSLE
ncbi:transcriptional regulator [Paenibacillus sp. HN-1]|uniref:helix-turn-helix transcriptional regulator n=1 Tax=Paenibacillus TaxID=44249 RepID=UPI001CA84F11|nr:MULTISPECIES: WYL domain-containing protein [Paenibacillus]MBY9081619.1 transcriptional regulator [Paenibacillus sp. CGMCC 1.18879]MBY9083488.1 transcriptional regulator [Paenibacillus sinensis]